MRLYFLIGVIAIQAISLAAQATVYKFDYVGHISGGIQGNGMGYKIGDQVSGHLEFDLANSSGDLAANNYSASYRGKNNGSDFVISESTPGLNIPPQNLNWDQVYVYNGYLVPGGTDTRSVLVMADVHHHDNPWLSYGFQINVMWDGLDWFDKDKIPEFEINAASAFVDPNTGGSFFDDTAILLPNGTVSGALNTADFRFDYMKLSRVDLPEPSTFILALMGISVLIIRRKIQIAKHCSLLI